MDIRYKKMITATVIVAVTFIGLISSGCVTPSKVNELKSHLLTVESQNRETQKIVNRMDSLITASTEGNMKLQNEVRYSTDELTRQMAQLLENYNELMARIEQMSSKKVFLAPPKSSGGSQTDNIPATGNNPVQQMPAKPAFDCEKSYDDAFTLTRQGAYEKAIGEFSKFLDNCQTSDNIVNAYYWLGECYYAQEKYSQAITEYEHLVKTYPDSPNLSRALYKLARCKQETGNKTEARTLFEKLAADYAGSLEAEQATQRLKDL